MYSCKVYYLYFLRDKVTKYLHAGTQQRVSCQAEKKLKQKGNLLEKLSRSKSRLVKSTETRQG